MYLVKALRVGNAPVYPGAIVTWAVNQVGLVHDSVIQIFANNPDAFTVLAGPDFAAIVAQALTTASQEGTAAVSHILTGATAPDDYLDAVAASEVYVSAGDDNDLTITAVDAGVLGNLKSVSCVQAETVSAALSVTYVDGVALITLPSDGSGDPVDQTANEVKVAWDASDAVDAMTVEVEGDGTGIVAAFASAVLADGADVVGTGVGTADKGQPYIARDTGKMYLNGGTLAEPAWKIVTSA